MTYHMLSRAAGSIPILLYPKHLLIVGGGKVALQKAKVLFENGITFDLIAKEIHPELYRYAHTIRQKSLNIVDTKGYDTIIDATGDSKVLHQLQEAKRHYGFLLNVVDNPKACDFYFMALTPNAPLQIAVTSHGASPRMAQIVRDRWMRTRRSRPANLSSLSLHRGVRCAAI